jgi:2-polyprenyl-6-methoxyphenol hydroxylase-like FAD-dependent oxidoreductase
VTDRALSTQCCIAGGGPAGIMLAYLLARSGIDVVVLEKHADFFRDFRGDTIHPSTLQLMDELGLLDDLLKIPHSELQELTGNIGGEQIAIGDFSRVPGRCKFIAFMPQWDFLKFLSEKARAFPGFHLEMEAEATDLVSHDGRVAGVRASTPRGPLTVSAGLVVACDGRHSTLRERAQLQVIDEGAPIDALWMRISHAPNDPGQTFGTIVPGCVFVTIDRRDYYQCAMVIHKGGFAEIQSRGIDAFRNQIAEIAPYLADRVHELREWDDIKLLTVMVDHLQQWYRPGLLCIGDAAHAMSPIGGVGINLAIQDAVAAANLLTEPLRRGHVSNANLDAVQHRREFPMRVIQRMQLFIQDRVLRRVISTKNAIRLPRMIRWLASIAAVRRALAYFVGVGVRPEHASVARGLPNN